MKGFWLVSPSAGRSGKVMAVCLLAIGLFLSACGTAQETPDQEIPVVPLDFVQQAGGIVSVRAPLHARDSQLQLFEFDANGERLMKTYDEVIFPTDVLVVYSEVERTARVFLRRSPHGGCLLLWDLEASWIHDPCFGSRFDLNGAYLVGPSQRDLDQLPASIRRGMVWVGADVIYGETHP